MSPNDHLATFSEQVGFAVRIASDVVVAEGVPCLIANGNVGSCAIEKSFDPDTGKPNARVGGDAHAVKITVNEEHDGLVYHANWTPIGSNIGGDGKTWANISIKKGSQGSPEEDASARDVIHRYAKQIVGAVAAEGYSETPFLAKPGPFKIPNTFEARAAIGPVQDRVRNQRIAIIGLGGTGAHVLDLIAKTPVAEIHLLDDDKVDWHTFMRAPGAPTSGEVESQRNVRPRKIDYYYRKYVGLREGIYLHPFRLDSCARFSEFLSNHPVDYAFVCIDQQKNRDSPRQDAVYAALSQAGVPFTDSGVSITLANHAVAGAVTTGAYDAGSQAWKEGIPNARVDGDVPGYRNVQLPEVNALAAALAVMEWRRQTGQYVSHSRSFLHKFRLENGTVRHP